jgi:hypothetical protein
MSIITESRGLKRQTGGAMAALLIGIQLAPKIASVVKSIMSGGTPDIDVELMDGLYMAAVSVWGLGWAHALHPIRKVTVVAEKILEAFNQASGKWDQKGAIKWWQSLVAALGTAGAITVLVINGFVVEQDESGEISRVYRNAASLNANEIVTGPGCDTLVNGDAYWWHLRLKNVQGITTWPQCKTFCARKLDSLGFNVDKVRDILLGDSRSTIIETKNGDSAALTVDHDAGGFRPIETPVGWAIEVDALVARRWCRKFRALKQQYPNHMDFIPVASFRDSLIVWGVQ